MWTIIALLFCAGIVASRTPPSAQSARKDLLAATGSEEQLSFDLEDILRQATKLRCGVGARYVDFYAKLLPGFHGIVTPITFTDGMTWAVKMSTRVNDVHETQALYQGVSASRAIAQYCPSIPIPHVHGALNYSKSGRLLYYFMDWIDGIQLRNSSARMVNPVPKGAGRGNGDDRPWIYFSYQPNTIRQLAELFYNITTCPIPDHESSFSLAIPFTE
jgi:hypothetical protein